MRADVRKGYMLNPEAPVRFVRVLGLGSFETMPDDPLLLNAIFDESGWSTIEIDRDVFLDRVKVEDEKVNEHLKHERVISDKQLASMNRQCKE